MCGVSALRRKGKCASVYACRTFEIGKSVGWIYVGGRNDDDDDDEKSMIGYVVFESDTLTFKASCTRILGMQLRRGELRVYSEAIFVRRNFYTVFYTL